MPFYSKNIKKLMYILNYKGIVNSFYFDEKVLFNTDLYDCRTSSFCDPHHKHIITGDLKIIENKKLRKLLTKNLNYRKPKSINFTKAFFEIDQGLEVRIERISTKDKLETSTLTPWKEPILSMVKEQI